jgi:outer membrane protein OmpA-like peptidoglycan-associated protein
MLWGLGGGGSSDPDTGVNGMSGKRAKAVNDILVLNGIAQARVKYIGLGTSKPFVSPERTAADEALNRRVAIRILSK